MFHDQHHHHHDEDQEQQHLPCLQCHPHSYIRMVQHLIERCLILGMSRDHCIEALSQHASIEPLVTLTVWKELLKENREFFQSYFHTTTTTTTSPRAAPFMNGRSVHCSSRVSRFKRRKHWK